MTMYERPEKNEYHEFYATYVDKVPEGSFLSELESQHEKSQALLAEIEEERADHRYAPGKWSIKEVVGHLVDTERVFGFRALCFARRDPNPLPGMDQEVYIENGNFHQRTLRDVIAEWRDLRSSHRRLFASFDSEVQLRRGVASDFEVSVRALVYILLGHEIHHRGILRDRYL